MTDLLLNPQEVELEREEQARTLEQIKALVRTLDEATCFQLIGWLIAGAAEHATRARADRADRLISELDCLPRNYE
jgi:cob(I)alamin adenosyltransferase